MRTKTAVVTTVCAAAVLGGTAAVGTALAAGSSTDPQQYRTFTVVERALTDTTADTGPAGDSRGDVLAFANPVYDKANARKVGRDNGSCIRTAAGRAYECAWSLTLADGSLTVEGPFYDLHDSTLAVTGGTGAWIGARGQMRLHARDATGSSYDFTYRVAT